MSVTNSSTSYDPWVTQAGQGAVGGAQSWMAKNPFQAYSGPTTAAFGPQFGQASDYASNNLGQTNQWTTGSAASLQNLIGSIDPNASISSYMDPYVQATLQPTIQNIQMQGAQQRQKNGAEATMAGQYGGTGQGVENALTNRYEDQAIGNASGQAYSNAYNNATATRQGLLQTLLSGSTALGQQGQNAFNQGATLDQLLAGMGSTQQQAGAEGIKNAINVNTLNQTLPLQQYSSLADIIAGIPKNSSTTSTTIGSGQPQQNTNMVPQLLGSLGGTALSSLLSSLLV
jgi:hypothetical protein